MRDGGSGGLLRLTCPPRRARTMEELREAARRLDLLRPSDPAEPSLSAVSRTEWSNAWVT